MRSTYINVKYYIILYIHIFEYYIMYLLIMRCIFLSYAKDKSPNTVYNLLD